MDTTKQDRLRELASKQVFTTGEAAEICNVSQQTIIRCFDRGRLTGFRVPGSKFRRIPRAELLRFMHENGIPADLLGDSAIRILVVDDDPGIVRLMEELLGRDGRFEVRTATTGYDAGMATREFRPNLVLLDYMLPDVNGSAPIRNSRTPGSSSSRASCGRTRSTPSSRRVPTTSWRSRSTPRN
jgi:two-component system OmpR family response regulator